MKYYFKNLVDFDKKIENFRSINLVPKTSRINLIKFGENVFKSKQFKILPTEAQNQVKIIIEATIMEESASKREIIKFINLKEKNEINKFISEISKILSISGENETEIKQKIIKLFSKMKLDLKEFIHYFILNKDIFENQMLPELINRIQILKQNKNQSN